MSQAEKTFINSLLKVIWILLNHLRVTQPSSQATCTDGDIDDAIKGDASTHMSHNRSVYEEI